jgi:PAS fold
MGTQVRSHGELGGLDLLDTVEPLGIPSDVIDGRGTIRWLNPAARALAGNVVGRHFTDVVAPEYVGRAREQFLRKLHGKDATDFQRLLDLRRRGAVGSGETVRNHIRHVLRALGAHSRLEAVAMARRSGLFG